jgi:hypothetical protein
VAEEQPVSILDARVLASWPGMTEPLEGHIPWLYLDTRAIPTVGLGCVVLTAGASLAHPWQHLDGRMATPAEIVDDWQRVRAMPPGLLAARYRGGDYLLLADLDVAELARQRLEADAAVLAQRWPELPGWPPAAQAATLALSWAVGPGATGHGLESHEWPHAQAALDAEDWQAAAVAGQLKWADNPGVRPRDFVVSALYLEAAGEPGEVSRHFPEGPSRDAALRALAAWDAARPDV